MLTNKTMYDNIISHDRFERQERSEPMKEYTKKDREDGKRIVSIFAGLSEDAKSMAIVYLSALRDKEIADSGKKKELQKV